MNAYICISSTGNTPLTGFTIFQNVDNYLTPLVSNVPLINFLVPQCPYILTGVDPNTTIIRLYDYGAGCCVDIPYSDGFNICDICVPLGFSANSSPNVGSISVGQLSGGCDPSIGQYYLEWYGPGTGSTQLVFTSGFGGPIPNFNPYQQEHPLTGTSQVPVVSGAYRPIIKYIDANGIIYSWAFGATGDCFQSNPFIVLPYTATNGSGVDYEHELEFSGNSRPGFTQSGTIELSGTTNYVPFRFDGNLTKKLLRIEFSGSAYPVPLQLEHIRLGFLPTNEALSFNTTISPKRGGPNDDFFTRVLCLTGLTRNAGDTLTFYIDSPESSLENFISHWSFYFTQLPTFDCSSCILDTPKYLISGGSFTATTGTCSSTTVSFSVSGCSSTVDINKDLYKYIFKDSGFAYAGPFGYSANANGLIPVSVSLGNGVSRDCTSDVYYSQPSLTPNDCMDLSLSAGTNALAKMYINVTNPSSLNKSIKWFWYDSTVNPASAPLWNYLQSQWAVIDSAFPANAYPQSDYRYYNALLVTIPSIFVGPTSQCIDEPTRQYFINKNEASVTFNVTSSTTNASQSIYSMEIFGKIFANPQQLLNGYSGCDSINCKISGNSQHFSQIINKVQDSVASNLNIVNGVDLSDGGFFGSTVNPAYYTRYPFNVVFATQTQSASNPQGSTANTSNSASLYQYQIKTYPSSGAVITLQTVISSLTADTCVSLSGKTFNPFSADSPSFRSSYQKYHFYYDIVDNPLVPLGYSIYANDILANGQVSDTQTLIATGTGSTITVLNSSYFTP